MSETSKYDLLMDELSSLKKQVLLLVQKYNELKTRKEELEAKLNSFEKEKETLKLKFHELEENKENLKINGNLFFNNGNQNVTDKEILKSKISELITKIDYHLRS